MKFRYFAFIFISMYFHI